MKVALIISGMARTYREAYPLFYENFIKTLEADVDVYLHAWDVTGSIVFSVEGDKVQKDVQKNEIANADDLRTVFSPKKMVIEEYSSFEMRHTAKSEYLSRYASRKYIGIISQWYKAKRNFDMIDDPLSYDFIIRGRFDLAVVEPFDWQTFLNDPIKRRSLCYPDIENYGLDYLNSEICDVIAVGNPRNIQAYCCLYDRLIDGSYEHLCEVVKPHISSEFLMSWNLREMAIPCARLPIRFAIVRSSDYWDHQGHQEAKKFLEGWRANNPMPAPIAK